ncbi:MAG: copper amine oxidase N-terminal domain-containing protein [Ruminococcaceae bacterium]|nr:copper amine oxidase N-terminal domain-containing protein [Oscillospiraceae bacterium]
MKKFINIFIFLIFVFAVGTAYARIEPCDLVFKEAGGGTYIYENNIESIERENLSDKSNPDARYIMKNTSLKPGKYSVFITNLNNTGIKNEEGKIIEPGFSIEVDGLFETKTNAVIKITSLAYEMPHVKTLYSGGNEQRYEDSWSCMDAWATYLKMPIYQVNSYKRYYPGNFNEVKFGISNTKNVWLSQYIDNYSVVPYLKPVNILMDFEVLSGECDFNIAALKHTGTLKDRSNHNYNAKEDGYIRERQYKGIAETLPKVCATLNFNINNKDKDGAYLPVNIYNQYNTAGRYTEKWVTNLNPQNAKWAKDMCAESDMLVIKYKDEEKLNLYGDDVPDIKKDEWWYFDVFHTDTKSTDEEKNPQDENKFIPNRLVTRYEDNYLEACNLGNYGVRVNYKVTINNRCNFDRYVYYNLETSSNNIVILYDENMQSVFPYAISKGNKGDGALDTMACVKLEKNKKTTFYIDVILPANNNGGMINSFVLKDSPYEVKFEPSQFEVAKKGIKTDGKDFLVWNNLDLYKSSNLVNFEKINLSNEAKEIFKAEGRHYDIIATEGGYIAKWAEYDGAPSYYTSVLDFYNKVYIFDKDFNLVSEKTFDEYPTKIGYSMGKYYVCAGKNYYSENGKDWFELSTVNIPYGNNKIEISCTKYGFFFMSTPDMPFTKLDYEIERPKYIGALNDIFYYTDQNFLYLSKNGVYFEKIDAGEDIVTVDRIENEILVNNKTRIAIPSFNNDLVIRLKDEIIVQKDKPVLKDNMWYIAMRRICEKTDYDLLYNEQTGDITIKKIYFTAKMNVNETKAEIKGEMVDLKAKPVLINGEIHIPLTFITDYMGYDVDWNKELNILWLH